MGGTKAQDTTNLTANELKELGNKFFSQRKYSDAISLYTKAIVSDRYSIILYYRPLSCFVDIILRDSILDQPGMTPVFCDRCRVETPD